VTMLPPSSMVKWKFIITQGRAFSYILAVKRVEFVSYRMDLYIILIDRCPHIVLNVHAPSDHKNCNTINQNVFSTCSLKPPQNVRFQCKSRETLSNQQMGRRVYLKLKMTVVNLPRQKF